MALDGTLDNKINLLGKIDALDALVRQEAVLGDKVGPVRELFDKAYSFFPQDEQPAYKEGAVGQSLQHVVILTPQADNVVYFGDGSSSAVPDELRIYHHFDGTKIIVDSVTVSGTCVLGLAGSTSASERFKVSVAITPETQGAHLGVEAPAGVLRDLGLTEDCANLPTTNTPYNLDIWVAEGATIHSKLEPSK